MRLHFGLQPFSFLQPLNDGGCPNYWWGAPLVPNSYGIAEFWL